MGFRTLKIKEYYFSDNDDILHDFYIPVLKEAKKYYRLSGFFSSNIFVNIAEGLSSFIDNEGKIYLIVGALLNNEDINAINKGIKNPEKCIEEFLLDQLKTTKNKIIADHIKTLAYMVANKQLELKIALIVNFEGDYIYNDEIMNSGLFHLKVGILEDDKGNLISFSGSINETASAWTNNIEEFKVFRSWESSENKYLRHDVKKFESIWQGNNVRFKIYEIPEIVKKYLIDISLFESKRGSTTNHDVILRDYQSKAILSWKSNDFRGIYEMATGTGKTYTAIFSMIEAKKYTITLFTIIACPYTHLITQWEETLLKIGFSPIKIYGEVRNWKELLNKIKFEYNIGINKYPIILTTHDTLSNYVFIKIMGDIKGNVLLIGDEVHYLGSEKRRNGLLSSYNMRLGLSATPKRWFDDEGNEEIINYFNGVVYEYDLRKAIEEGYLVEYEYHPYFVELNDEEIIEYKEMTAKVAKSYYASKDEKEKSELNNLYLILRKKIVINAEEKYEKLRYILNNLQPIRNCLIYCSPEQINIVQDLLNEMGIMQHKFTAREDIFTRKKLLDSFDKGSYQALVAMRCLDEGVDVPSTRKAILLANSTNPREFIQRRGRILRPYSGKRIAHIYDIIVVPTLHGEVDEEFYDLERKIMISELLRFHEFAINSNNYEGIKQIIKPIGLKYNIKEGDYS